MPRTCLSLIAAVVLLCGCSNGGGVQPLALATTTTTTTTAPLTPESAAVAFGACLEARGFAVAQPPFDESGRPDLSAIADSVDQTTLEWRQALTSCAAILALSGALDLGANPELAEAVLAQLRTFSECMRSQGVEEFPDPLADFDGTSVPFPLSLIPLADPELATAVEACVAVIGVDPIG
ncbi:MAG: hypothetical protein ACRDWH_00690 [Acidimicrobiia bacterium]